MLSECLLRAHWQVAHRMNVILSSYQFITRTLSTAPTHPDTYIHPYTPHFSHKWMFRLNLCQYRCHFVAVVCQDIRFMIYRRGCDYNEFSNFQYTPGILYTPGSHCSAHISGSSIAVHFCRGCSSVSPRKLKKCKVKMKWWLSETVCCLPFKCLHSKQNK